MFFKKKGEPKKSQESSSLSTDAILDDIRKRLEPSLNESSRGGFSKGDSQSTSSDEPSASGHHNASGFNEQDLEKMVMQQSSQADFRVQPTVQDQASQNNVIDYSQAVASMGQQPQQQASVQQNGAKSTNFSFGRGGMASFKDVPNNSFTAPAVGSQQAEQVSQESSSQNGLDEGLSSTDEQFQSFEDSLSQLQTESDSQDQQESSTSTSAAQSPESDISFDAQLDDILKEYNLDSISKESLESEFLENSAQDKEGSPQGQEALQSAELLDEQAFESDNNIDQLNEEDSNAESLSDDSTLGANSKEGDFDSQSLDDLSLHEEGSGGLEVDEEGSEEGASNDSYNFEEKDEEQSWGSDSSDNGSANSEDVLDDDFEEEGLVDNLESDSQQQDDFAEEDESAAKEGMTDDSDADYYDENSDENGFLEPNSTKDAAQDEDSYNFDEKESQESSSESGPPQQSNGNFSQSAQGAQVGFDSEFTESKDGLTFSGHVKSSTNNEDLYGSFVASAIQKNQDSTDNSAPKAAHQVYAAQNVTADVAPSMHEQSDSRSSGSSEDIVKRLNESFSSLMYAAIGKGSSNKARSSANGGSAPSEHNYSGGTQVSAFGKMTLEQIVHQSIEEKISAWVEQNLMSAAENIAKKVLEGWINENMAPMVESMVQERIEEIMESATEMDENFEEGELEN